MSGVEAALGSGANCSCLVILLRNRIGLKLHNCYIDCEEEEREDHPLRG